VKAGIAIIVALASATSLPRVVLAEPRESLAWQLRPLTSESFLRIDSAAAAFTDDNGNLDLGVSSIVSASYQRTSHWAPTIRLGVVKNNAPGSALDGSSFGNPVAGVTYTRSTGRRRLALSWATTVPVGTGGGDDPDPRAEKTNTAAITARPADSAMFEVNYLTQIVGVDAAYVNRGFTAQAAATLIPGVRVRGGGTERFRASSAVALHLGYFLGSHVSLGGDVRYQRRLTHPAMLDAMNNDLLTVTAGVRLHLRIGDHVVRPGISYTRGLDPGALDAPWINARANTVQLDVPVTL
jgi:hypothetical protein